MSVLKSVGEEKVSAPRRLRAIVNGEGGAAKARGGSDALRRELTELATRAALTLDLVVAPPGDLSAAIETARDDAQAGRLDAVLIGGGDGTIASAATILAETGIPLGVLPLGTVNHFAKDIGMPTELEAAFKALRSTVIAEVDLGAVNGHIFTNNAVIGAHPFMVAERDRRQQRHGWSKWPAMAWAFLKLLRRLPRRRLALQQDGRTQSLTTPLVFVGVNTYEIEALDLRRLKGMNQGQLWVLVAHHQNALAFLGFMLRSLIRGFDWEGDFEASHAERLVIDSRKAHLAVTLNGELFRLSPPLTFEIRPRALTILKPQPAAAEA